MASAGEQHLAQTLIDPENLDNPDPTFERGTRQEPTCRDAWAAILFYVQFVAIAVVAGWLGVPAVEKAFGDDANVTAGGDVQDYSGLIYAALIAGGSSFVLSALSLFVMSCCPKLLVKVSLLLSVVFALLVALWSFAIGSVIGGVFGIIFFLLTVCYAFLVWRRIPFAAANLNTGLTAVKANGGVFVVAYLIVILCYGYAMLWMTAAVGVYDKEGVCQTTEETTTSRPDGTDTSTTTCTGNLAWGYFFLLLLALFWTQQVFQNTIHVIIAGVVSTWWFAPDEASSFCSGAIWGSFVRATTTSFGSICFGSLLVAIVETLKSMAQSARANGDAEGCAAFLLCLVECLLQCLQDMLEYFNKFAYIYVGMYGYSYLEAGKNVFRLFNARGWSVIIADDLVSNVLFLFILVIGGLNGCVGFAIEAARPGWFAGFEGQGASLAFGFSFLVGVVVASVLLSVVNSSVNTVLVAFAEAPAEFEENHPELSAEMREGWRKVYPEECGF